MSAVGSTVIEVHWVVTIQVRARRDLIRVPVPDRACVIRRVEHKRVGMLAQTI